jgi:tetratricopeptide (TPR) repeat protein
MQKAAKSSFFLTDFFSLKVLADLQKASRQTEFYQQFLKGLVKGVYIKQAFSSLSDKLITIADHACDLRQTDTVEQVSRFFLNLPLDNEYKSIGRYYGALSAYERGNRTEALTLLERLMGEVPSKFRARPLVALSRAFGERGDLQSFLLLCSEAGRAASCREHFDVQALITSQRNIAIYRSLNGDHRGALNDLERIFPMVRAVSRWHPYLYYEHLNSLAVELSAVGRLEEARNVCKIALASPYANAYPEWRETSYDLAFKGYRSSRSVISLFQRTLPNNLLHLPERKSGPGQASFVPKEEATVTSLLEWKNKMVKEPNGEEENENIEEMNDKDMIVKLLQLTAHEGVDENKLRKVLRYAMKIFSEPDKD